MTDTSTTSTAPAKPETWEQEAWDALVEAEQWVVADLHDIGVVFTNDVWPALKAGFILFGSQLFGAIFTAVSANITDPALMPAAVGSAALLTASVSGVVDAKNTLATAEAAIKADPAVQALLNPTSSVSTAPPVAS